MTDQLMFERWTELLRPQFPRDAEFSSKPRRRALNVTWEPADSATTLQSVTITFTNLAWKAYRGARAARRARADHHLEALVKAHLAQSDALHEGSFDARSGELSISVASVDIFPPPSGISASVGARPVLS